MSQNDDNRAQSEISFTLYSNGAIITGNVAALKQILPY